MGATSVRCFSRMIAAAACALSVLAVPSAQAATVMAPGSPWFYTDSNPTAIVNWTTAFPGLPWNRGNAPFSNVTSGDFRYDTGGTFWPSGSAFNRGDLWIGTVVDFTGFDRSTALWQLGVANGFTLYVNGMLIAGDLQDGFTSRWEYSGSFPALNPGLNFIALALDDFGGSTAFDMQITARSTVIPLPAAGWMLLGGLGLLALQGRCRRSSGRSLSSR